MAVVVENGTVRVDPLIRTPYIEQWPEFSPDGHWLAYGSNATGRTEVYVRAYPESGPAVPVSVEGGRDLAWHPSGREILFQSLADPAGKRRMISVAFTPGSPPGIGRPKELFSYDPREVPMTSTPVRCYDVAADGQRFYAVQRVTPPSAPVVTHINLILNWFEELKAKAPLK